MADHVPDQHAHYATPSSSQCQRGDEQACMMMQRMCCFLQTCKQGPDLDIVIDSSHRHNRRTHCMINISRAMDTVIGSSHLYDSILGCIVWAMHILLFMDAGITAAGAINKSNS